MLLLYVPSLSVISCIVYHVQWRIKGGLGGTCPPSTDVNDIHLHCCWLNQPLCKLFVTTGFIINSLNSTRVGISCKLVKMSTLQPEMQQIWHLMNTNKPKFSPGVQAHPAVPPPILFSKSAPACGQVCSHWLSLSIYICFQESCIRNAMSNVHT